MTKLAQQVRTRERILKALVKHGTELGWNRLGVSKLSDATYQGLVDAVMIELECIEIEGGAR